MTRALRSTLLIATLWPVTLICSWTLDAGLLSESPSTLAQARGAESFSMPSWDRAAGSPSRDSSPRWTASAEVDEHRSNTAAAASWGVRCAAV
jgi:hypothetical protein